MCGIAAFLGEDAAAGQAFAARANQVMAHRGPNDHDTYTDTGVVLAHRRLSILDLSRRGHQPMVSPDGRYVLSYNGEIYNHWSLRPALERHWTFQSTCDTETLLAALAIDGPAALKGMVGMWALTLWDTQEQRLLVSRDRYGQKPLYWRQTPDGALRFASEIAALIEPDERPTAHAPALAEFLALGSYDHIPGRTFFEDVRAFPPGCSAWVERGARTVSPERYWRFPVKPKSELRPFDETARKTFHAAFMEAVESQVLSDVPVAATLSGGIDSSCVVGAMASLASAGPVKVFTAQAKGSAYDESAYVAAVKQRWGDRLDIETIASERIVLSRLAPEVVQAQGEPFGDPSMIAHNLIVRAAAGSGIGVLIGGQGADEILFGYPYMSASVLASELRCGDRLWALGQMGRLGRGVSQQLRVVGSAVAPGLEQVMRRRSHRAHSHWLTPALRTAGEAGAPTLAPLSDIQAFWRESVEAVALPHLVHYDDHNTMRYSIEGRMPFLDHRLAEVLSGIDTPAFFQDGRRKAPLREACADLLPQAVIDRRDKIGFHTPLPDLLRAEIDWVRGWVCGDAARAAGLYDVAWMDARCAELAAGSAEGYAAGAVWRALVVMLWADAFKVDLNPAGQVLDPRAQAA